ncbi:allantoinase [Acrocarpospora phusangensis]|uniref:allantoinase n=1 Tax=Acrocarpospora phusangensis TaxID=1070424 RepID=A0A919QAF6_9ACTN|nr:allantoinase AllB [Acrocarpospora phusangensis]GIH23080.1 allantoinase [Acrocarpospora phusangensis]
MSEFDLVVRSRRTVAEGGERALAVAVRDGRVAGVFDYGETLDARESVDLGEVALLPGLVDTHVHVNEPGRTHWEGFASATRAAAAGGVTTIVDMPLNSLPPTTTVSALEIKKKAALGQCHVDVGFWGGAVPANIDDLEPLFDAGVFGVKCFLSPSGVDEFPALDSDQLIEVMRRLAAIDGLLIVHAEDPATLTDPIGPTYPEFLDSRTQDAELRAVERVIDAAALTGGRAHIVHISAGSCVEPLRRAQESGIRVTAETCPHYLTLTAEEVTSPAFKCCPPIRESANRDALWYGLATGTLMGIVSDHSPCPADLKGLAAHDYSSAWGGIASLQLGLPVIWTEARRRGHTLPDVATWMASGPADLVGLSHKGRIAIGSDADLVAFDPTADFTVTATDLHHKNPITPYDGRTLTGVVHTTWLRGTPIQDTPHGTFLRSSAARP